MTQQFTKEDYQKALDELIDNGETACVFEIGGSDIIRSALQLAIALQPRPIEVAKLFHDTYETLAPTFGYETRPETKVSWDELPEDNKQLMINTVEIVLNLLFTKEEK